MKIVNFVKKLLPSLDKKDILEDMRITIAELDNIVIPEYSKAVTYLQVNTLKQEQIKDMSIAFYESLDAGGIARQSNIVAEVSVRLSNIRDNTIYIRDNIEKILSEDVISASLDAKKAIYIRAASDMSFISRYAPDLLNLILAVETDTVDSIPPSTIKYVERNLKQFVYLLSDYGITPKVFNKTITAVPDIVIGGDAGDKAAAVYSNSELDPLETSYINNFYGNPIYYIRTAIATWQSNRYKSSKDKKKVLELRLLYLKSLNENKNDAKLEREIEFTQSRVDKIDRKLRAVEEDLGV